MFRGTTARTAFALLAAALLALAFFAPAPSFAPAHTVRQAEAKTKTGIKPVGKPLRDEFVTVRDCGHGGPADPLRSRDRHRATTAAASAPQEPERTLLALDPAAAHPPARPADPHHRASRSSAGHSPAALQVFRC
ncbi:hypothetical protein ABZ464_45535 [Streptomyces sp. NPDC005820]|uniref:hypothetical protein n=1 Tax=Streptomyces sp. NPDC005820 TaxID=3157069 RepID=UPI0033D1478C